MSLVGKGLDSKCDFSPPTVFWDSPLPLDVGTCIDIHKLPFDFKSFKTPPSDNAKRIHSENEEAWN